MNLLQIITLSIVEGVTEFLPISSTGHLILVSGLLKIIQSDFVKTFQIFIQAGAILAVLTLYFNTLRRNRRILFKIFISFLPAALTGLIFYRFIKTYLLGNQSVTIASLITGGIIIITIEKLLKNNNGKVSDLSHIGFFRAFIIGLFQSTSIIPGVSRAAASIIGGLAVGLNRETATVYSFLLAIPTISAATLYDLYKEKFIFSIEEMAILATGVIFSFFSALITVKFLIKFTAKHSFTAFGVYRIIIGLLFLFLLY
ncbi:hypothetical protein A3I80_06220 [Candidatus Gottesmanbacteria bacterium RIFCSPLOWO2_02_FULL_40_10]|nr:MAG: hypothetical protein A3I80_06220 [Candidatus Gottesmanbacteria bacterium RIFCSPLOWO2_02_FULL_40_10]